MIPPKQPTQPQKSGVSRQIRILTQTAACAMIKAQAVLPARKQHKPLKASSGQGENPYRR
jgi:hypothetical protein